MTWLPETDLLSVTQQRPPLGGEGFVTRWGTTRSVWAPLDDGRSRAPEAAGRIIHERCLELFAPALLDRVGLRATQGYHKCGSGDLTDAPTEVRILSWQGGSWTTVLEVQDDEALQAGGTRWYDLGGVESLGAIVQVRRAALDGPWTSWNLAEGGVVLRGRPSAQEYRIDERRLRPAGIELNGLPDGVAALAGPGEVRFRTARYQVGFRLGRPGFSFLALDGEGNGRTERNLLYAAPGFDLQGPMFHAVGHAPDLAPALRCAIDGEVQVRGNSVTYTVEHGDQELSLTWTARADRLELTAVREATRDVEAWESSVWQTAIDGRRSTAAALGRIEPIGRTGLLTLPVLWHAPQHGTVRIASTSPETTWRSDANRPQGWLTGELGLAQTANPEGTVTVRSGRHEAQVDWVVGEPHLRTRPNTPTPVQRALQRTLLTGLTFRADTATLSNNSMSIHCPMSMDTWSRVAAEVSRVAPEVPALDVLRYSLERWLNGGPGYASGPLRVDGEVVLAEDDYLITGASALAGAADYLRATRDIAWLAAHSGQLRRVLDELRARDLDGDGMIESPRRQGNSGEGQWSTNWYDVVSFGWKDAWVNAVLYRALTQLDELLGPLGFPELAEGLSSWAEQLSQSYRETLINPETGWVAGWRSADGQLHDYAFPAVNGAAVTSGVLRPEEERAAMRGLWEEMERCEFDRSLGLPNCLRKISDDDLTGVMRGYPHGFYLNGALSHSQSRHFVEALYKTGMVQEADSLLVALCEGLADGDVYGGSQSGRDWRHWDGEPCGYEGLLTEQFGIVGTALDRFGADADSTS